MARSNEALRRLTTIEANEPNRVEATSHPTEWALFVRGTLRGYYTGSREAAQREVDTIVRGLEADARWYARKAEAVRA